jgi:hypothetical protein
MVIIINFGHFINGNYRVNELHLSKIIKYAYDIALGFEAFVATVYEEESVNRSQMDIKRKTGEVRT